MAKLTILLIIVGTLTISGFTLFLSQETPEVIRLLINTVLCWFLYQGRSWARWTTGVLHSLAAIFGLIAASESAGAEATPLLIMGIFYALASFLLLSGILIKKHFEVSKHA